jgi:methyltransferase
LPEIAPLAIAAALACQALRWWCIATLGRQWNTRVIVVPGLPRISTGPYRWLRHPNYLAVIVEGIALPAVSGSWITASVFTLANTLLLRTRVRAENRALEALSDPRVPDTPVAEGGFRGFGNRA